MSEAPKKIIVKNPEHPVPTYYIREDIVEELREALENLMGLESRNRIMPIGKEWDAARAALAKARGEG